MSRSRNEEALRLHALGIEERDRGDWSAALALFQAVLTLEEAVPEDKRMWGSYGMTLHEIAWVQLQLGHLEEAWAGFDAARKAKERVPNEHQNWDVYSTTLHELGFVQHKLGQHAAAVQTLRDAVAANQNIADAGTRNRADAASLDRIARIHRDRKEWADAAATFAAALACADRVAPGHQHPLPTDTHYWLAYVLVELERWDDALAAARAGRTLLESMPPAECDSSVYYKVLRELAHIHTRRGEWSEAAHVLRVARQVRRRRRLTP